MDISNARCPECRKPMMPVVCVCEECKLRLEGSFEVSPLALLSAEDQAMAVAFIRSFGSIKALQSTLGVSYPTARNRLGGLVEKLNAVLATSPDRWLPECTLTSRCWELSSPSDPSPEEYDHPVQFVTPGDRRTLLYDGEKGADSHWSDGVLRTEEGDMSFPVEDGIPRFRSDNPSWWDDEKARARQFRKSGIDADTLAERNWSGNVKRHTSKYESWLRPFLEIEGPIVEIGVGPGAGAAPIILKAKPDANIVINDLGCWPLREWQKLARRKGCWPNLRFAQFDATQMPIASNSVPAVVGWGVLFDVSIEKTPREVFRVLRPGGIFGLMEGLPEMQLTSESPPNAHDLFHEAFPFWNTDFKALLTDVGFRAVDVRRGRRRAIIPNEGGLADFADKYRVDMQIQFYLVQGEKPEQTKG